MATYIFAELQCRGEKMRSEIFTAAAPPRHTCSRPRTQRAAGKKIASP